MDRRKIFNIIGVILILILMAAIVYFLYVKNLSLADLQPKKIVNLLTNKQPAEKEVKKISFNDNQTEQPKENQPAVPKELTKDDVARLAGNFVERFGTYSNQANYRNLTEAKIFMTPRMQAWTDSYLNQLRAASSSTNIYNGITTISAVKEIKDFDAEAGQATILIHTRRQEANGAMENVSQTFNQDITIKLVKTEMTWLVNSAVWESK